MGRPPDLKLWGGPSPQSPLGFRPWRRCSFKFCVACGQHIKPYQHKAYTCSRYAVRYFKLCQSTGIKMSIVEFSSFTREGSSKFFKNYSFPRSWINEKSLVS